VTETVGDASTIADGTPASEAASASTTPDPRYTLGKVIGRGGMGEVRIARDRRVDRDVAIKVLRGERRSEDAIARFLREARVQGRLEHPAIVPVHDLGVDPAGEPYFVMKRLAGVTLADVVRTGDALWPKRRLLARLVDVCLAVEFAHTRGVIHRDLKPANVMLGDFGEVYVLDWGLARIADDDPTGPDDPSPDHAGIVLADLRATSDSSGHTVAGALLGTPGYMAPEQMRGEAVDKRADVYALGLVLYEIVTRVPAIPTGGDAFEATLAATCFRPSAVAPDIAPELDDICAHATAADRAARLPTARALADRIQAYLDGDRDLARRRELATELSSACSAP
jgi:serine/threonine-protein kinase